MIYRLKTVPEGTHDEGLKAGSLCFPSASRRATLGPLFVTSRADGYGYSTQVSEEDVERSPTIRSGDFELYLQYLARGYAVLPNAEPEDVDRAINNLASWGGGVMWPHVQYVLLPGDERSRWARLLLGRTQAGHYDGTGLAFVYRRHFGAGLESIAPVWRFAICKHEPVEGAGANHSRGWHPAHCPKCGLNMSVDSSD